MATRAVVLFSGGLDSTVLLAMACWSYDDVHALTFYYGQRHSNEISAARRIAVIAGVKHHFVYIDAGIWKQQPLITGKGLDEGRTVFAIRDGGIPSAFIPGRNMVFLSHAVALTGVLGGGDVLIGATSEDQGGFPDCRPWFFTYMEKAAEDALTGMAIRVRAPLMGYSKRDVVQLAQARAIDIDQTWSCYRPVYDLSGAKPCGRCDACVIRDDAVRVSTTQT